MTTIIITITTITIIITTTIIIITTVFIICTPHTNPFLSENCSAEGLPYSAVCKLRRHPACRGRY
jgi:hypothetical protein